MLWLVIKGMKISWLALECLRVPPDELKEERDIAASLLWLAGWQDGWRMAGWMDIR